MSNIHALRDLQIDKQDSMNIEDAKSSPHLFANVRRTDPRNQYELYGVICRESRTELLDFQQRFMLAK